MGALATQAADFSVGRVDIRFAEPDWKEVALSDQAQAYGGEKDGALAVQSKLYVREAAGQEGQTLVLVSANSQGLGGGRGGYMTYTPDCKPDGKNHREGSEGFSARFLQCLTVTPQYTSDSVFKALAPQVIESLPGGVPPSHVVWGRQLMDAVKSSVHSLSGNLTIPAMRLAPSASGRA
jgi:hypothetical protein